MQTLDLSFRIGFSREESAVCKNRKQIPFGFAQGMPRD